MLLQLSQGAVGAAMLIAGSAVVYLCLPTAGQSEKIGDNATPFISVACAGLIFSGAMLVFAALFF
jgi:hypothetical protein